MHLKVVFEVIDMGSIYLNRLSGEKRETLQNKLLIAQKNEKTQTSNCFICGKTLDPNQNLHIDHVIPINAQGKDEESNFALVHSSCNESKQDADLRVARILARFKDIRDLIPNRGPNLSDVLSQYGGSKHDLILDLSFKNKIGEVKYSFSQIGDNTIYHERVYKDELSGFKYFFALLPLEYLFHDDTINPRSIGQNVSKLVKEFFSKYPQLHISLAWFDSRNNNKNSRVKIFDGQHKAAAQILLGTKKLPVRIFILSSELELETLRTANTHAATNLIGIPFDKSVQAHLGNTIYLERIRRYKKELNISEDQFGFSERDLVNYYKGESKAMKKYILDSVRDSITYNEKNRLIEFVDFGGRKNEKPLSYSTIAKTFYSFFINQEVLSTNLDYRFEEGENPRELEKEQILKLMNIISEEIFIGKFNPEIGTSKIENKIQKGEDIPEEHLTAYRMAKEEIIYNWLIYIKKIAEYYFLLQGEIINDERLFQCIFPESLWDTIRVAVNNLKDLPFWVNRDLSLTAFGGKQNYDYWRTVFDTAKTPQGVQVLTKPITIPDLIRKRC